MLANLMETSALLNQNYQKVYRAYRRGFLPGRKLGNEVFVDVDKATRIMGALEQKEPVKQEALEA